MNESFFLNIGDIFFTCFHSALIVFNLFGWAWKPLRKWHLVSISLTFASWIVLGIWYGWGYCPLTDWHWEILSKMGKQNLPHSYIAYLMQRVLSLNLATDLVNALTLGLALMALALSLFVNFKKRRK
ncbi:DUF2784 domain-containing protein [Cecembia calidifontis]|jgi:hypothetical protein|uniref:DUF2784 domain-containing protein n=1 Tax=Cecembia calidifontis TaxID=1187080 RepID=UPI001029CB11|nr:DUF2784 domain-containing protein [Cecembia calidifontis]